MPFFSTINLVAMQNRGWSNTRVLPTLKAGGAGTVKTACRAIFDAG